MTITVWEMDSVAYTSEDHSLQEHVMLTIIVYVLQSQQMGHICTDTLDVAIQNYTPHHPNGLHGMHTGIHGECIHVHDDVS